MSSEPPALVGWERLEAVEVSTPLSSGGAEQAPPAGRICQSVRCRPARSRQLAWLVDRPRKELAVNNHPSVVDSALAVELLQHEHPFTLEVPGIASASTRRGEKRRVGITCGGGASRWKHLPPCFGLLVPSGGLGWTTLRAGVTDYQNPAGRLHGLLTRFGTHSARSIQTAWATVLEVSSGDVALYLGDVASLLRDVRDAAAETGMDAFEPIPGSLTTLSRSIFPVDVPFSRPASEVLPDPTAMQMLKMLSAYLETTAPEGKIPDAAEVEELRLDFADLIETVTAADLPPEIRRALLHRLSDIVEALEHLQVGGPDAVRRAAEALAISAVLYEEDAQDNSGVFARMRASAQKAWVAFTVVSTLAGAVITFDRLTGMEILPPPEAPLQLPSGPPPTEGDDVTGPRIEPI